jgi:hypothetical protein
LVVLPLLLPVRLLLLLVSIAAAAGTLWVDRVLDWGLSVNGLLRSGELGLLVQVTHL